MKIVYQSDDGTVWNRVEDAQNRDTYAKEVYALSKHFDTTISSGEFIQRTEREVKNLISDTYDLLIKFHSKESEIANRWKKDPRGFVGRFLSDGNDPAYHLYGIVISIDKNNRQWQQPYYAIEANKKNDGGVK